MSSELFSALKQKIILSGLAVLEEIQSCSQDEIEEVERVCGVQLPQAYRHFLTTMGKGAGEFLSGTDAFYPDILHLRRYAEDLLGEDANPFRLSEDAFVYLVHQGYQFMYFQTLNVGDDPPIFHYTEGAMMPARHSASFSEFLSGAIGDYTNAPS